MRLEDLLKSFSPWPRPPGDHEIYTVCPACGKRQSLGEARLLEKCGETLYECLDGCRPIAAVGLPDGGPWEGRGYRIGPYLLKNAEDLLIPVIGTGSFITLPGIPDPAGRP